MQHSGCTHQTRAHRVRIVHVAVVASAIAVASAAATPFTQPLLLFEPQAILGGCIIEGIDEVARVHGGLESDPLFALVLVLPRRLVESEVLVRVPRFAERNTEQICELAPLPQETQQTSRKILRDIKEENASPS